MKSHAGEIGFALFVIKKDIGLIQLAVCNEMCSIPDMTGAL